MPELPPVGFGGWRSLMRKDTGAIEKDVNDEDGPIGKQSLTEVELIPGFFFLTVL